MFDGTAEFCRHDLQRYRRLKPLSAFLNHEWEHQLIASCFCGLKLVLKQMLILSCEMMESRVGTVMDRVLCGEG